MFCLVYIQTLPFLLARWLDQALQFLLALTNFPIKQDIKAYPIDFLGPFRSDGSYEVLIPWHYLLKQ